MAKKEKNIDYFQSAVVPLRFVDSQLQVLMVTSSKRRYWIIPKGSIEKEMSAADSAMKKAYEEAGIQGIVNDSSIGEFFYYKSSLLCHVQVFLMRVITVLDQWPESKIRQRRWMSIDQAADIVTFSDLSQILSTVQSLDETGELMKRQI